MQKARGYCFGPTRMRVLQLARHGYQIPPEPKFLIEIHTRDPTEEVAPGWSNTRTREYLFYQYPPNTDMTFLEALYHFTLKTL